MQRRTAINAQAMWNAFVTHCPEAADAPWDAYAFSDAPDELAALVLAGRKRATASAHRLYEVVGEPVPVAGVYSVLLNSQEEAVCILHTHKVTLIPYHAVGTDFAALEGEGDLSLDWWRKVHEPFFREGFKRADLSFTEDELIVCEEFEVVYA